MEDLLALITLSSLQNKSRRIDRVTRVSEEYDLETYTNKTKLLIISKRDNVNRGQLVVNRKNIEPVAKCKYLEMINKRR